MRTNKFGLLALTTLVLAGSSVMAFAQAAPGAPAAGGGRGQGQGGRGGQGRGMQITVANLSVSTLDLGVKLTAAQKATIASIYAKRDSDTKALPAAPAFTPGTPPTPEQQQAMRDSFQKRQEINTKVEADVTAALTDAQKTALPDFLKEVGTLQQAGIPAGVLGDLKLTDAAKKSVLDQATKSQTALREKMAAARQAGQQLSREDRTAAQKEATDSVMALLTPTQKALVEKYVKDHPQPAFGGFGGGRRGGGAAPAPGGN